MAENAHFSRLTEDLLVLSRARGGTLPLLRVRVWLPDVVAHACRRGELLAGPVHVAFRADSAQATLDPVWFRQVIHNLVDNAVKHTPEGGRVDVSTTRQDSTTVLTVADTGSGFSAAEIATVFEPFAQSAAAPHDHGSTGLGLAVVRLIAHAHGGSARAENLTSGGAKITVTIPDGAPGDQGIVDA